MRSGWLVCGLLVLACSPVRMASAQRVGEDLLPGPRQLSRLGLERAWNGQAKLNPQRDKVTQFVVDEDMLFVQTTAGLITAFDSETGREAWAVLLGRHDDPMFPVVSSETEAMVVVGPTLYSLSKATGQIRWELRLPEAPSTSIAVDENHVYIGTLGGAVYAYNLKRIRALFEESLLPAWSNDALVWKCQVGKAISSPPIPTGRIVSFASRDGSLYGVTATRREVIYQLETNNPINTPLGFASHKNLLTNAVTEWTFIAARDQSFYSVESETGRVRWEFITGKPVNVGPMAVNYDLFLILDHGGAVCLNQRDGEPRWSRPNLTGIVAVAGDTVYGSDVEGNLISVDRGDGAVNAAVNLRNYSQRIANELTDRLYLATDAGTIVCLRQTGRRFPTYHRHPERLPLMPEFASEDGSEEVVEPPAANPPAAAE